MERRQRRGNFVRQQHLAKSLRTETLYIKNTTRSGWKQNRTTPAPTIEAEVYEALRGNDNILDGELVDYNGEQKIKTPYVKNIVGTDTIAKEKRQSIGKNIVSSNFDGIANSIMALSEVSYAHCRIKAENLKASRVKERRKDCDR